VVEDEFLIATDLEALLEDLGHEVVGTADTIENALAIAQSHHPHVATIDLRLKRNQDGAEAAEGLAKLGIEVIFVSGNLNDRTRAELEKRVKFFAFVGKPVSPHLIKQALEKLEIAQAPD
jgi:CheY-like chemotaxis protein